MRDRLLTRVDAHKQAAIEALDGGDRAAARKELAVAMDGIQRVIDRLTSMMWDDFSFTEGDEPAASGASKQASAKYASERKTMRHLLSGLSAYCRKIDAGADEPATIADMIRQSMEDGQGVAQ